MNLKDTLELIVAVDTSAAEGKLTAFASKSQQEAQKATDALAKYKQAGAQMMAAGAAGMAAGGLLTMMGSKEQAASNQLKAAIEQVGGSMADFESKISKAEDTEAHFGNTSAQTKDALTKLTLAFNDPTKALDMMQLATDLAARKHIGLADAAGIVARVHGGAVKPLKEFGIQVELNADGTKNMDKALSDLAGKLDGQAAASADTFGGKLNALKARAENFAAVFGEKFGPAILGVSTILTASGAVTTAVTGIMEKRAAATLANVGTDETLAAANLGLAASEETVAVATGELLIEMAPWLIAAAAAVAALELLSMSQGGNTRETEGYTAAIKNQTGELNSNVDAVTAKALIDNAGATAAHDAGISYKTMGDAVRTGTDDFGGYVRAAKGAVNNNTDLAGGLKAAGAQTTEFGRELLSLVENHKITAAQALILTQSIEGLHNGYAEATTASNDLKEANSEMSSDASGPNKDAIDAEKKSLQDLGKAADDASAAIDRQVAASHGLLSADLRAQTSGLDIANAQAKVGQAQAKLGTGATPEENAQFQRDYERAQLDVTAAVNSAAEAEAELEVKRSEAADGLDHSKDSTKDYRDALDTLNQGLNGPTHEAVQAQIDQMDELNERLKSTVQLTQEWHDIAAGKLGDSSDNRVHSATDAGGRTVQLRAGGGRVGRNSPYVVGENRAELFVPDQAGYILPNADAAMSALASASGGPMMGSAGGGIYAPITVVEAGNGRATASYLVDKLRQLAYMSAA